MEGVNMSRLLERTNCSTLVQQNLDNLTSSVGANPTIMEKTGDPVVYIVTVLLFYSCFIVTLMILYMKKNRTEGEENYETIRYLKRAR